MATKSITITTDAYERLAGFKGSKDSFSDVINKLTNRSDLKDIIGVLSKSEAKAIEKNIKIIRKNIRKRVNKTFETVQ